MINSQLLQLHKASAISIRFYRAATDLVGGLVNVTVISRRGEPNDQDNSMHGSQWLPQSWKGYMIMPVTTVINILLDMSQMREVFHGILQNSLSWVFNRNSHRAYSNRIENWRLKMGIYRDFCRWTKCCCFVVERHQYLQEIFGVSMQSDISGFHFRQFLVGSMETAFLQEESSPFMCRKIAHKLSL